MAAYATLLVRLSGQSDFAVGVPILNRPARQFHETIGCFANPVTLRFELKRSTAFTDLVAITRDQVFDAIANGTLPFQEVVQALRPVGLGGQQPLFQTMFAFQDGREVLQLSGVGAQAIDVPTLTSPYEVTLIVEDCEGAVAGRFEYATELFDPGTMRHWASYYETLLRSAVSGPDRPALALEILPRRVRTTITRTWNQTAVQAPFVAVHEVFEQHARATPRAEAIRWHGGVISYGELNRRADAVASRLMKGQGDVRIVGLYTGRSPETALAMLGSLKAGWTYVPLDPSYPSQRLRAMVKRAQVRIILSTDGLGPEAETLGAEEVVSMSEAAHGTANVTDQPRCQPDLGAYIIFTSGTTGEPKGPVITHGALANVMAFDRRVLLQKRPARVAQLSAPSFGGVPEEVFSALTSGGVLCIPDPHQMLGERLCEFLREERIEVAVFPPALLGPLHAVDLPDLRCIGVAGEACPAALAVRWGAGRRFINLYGTTETAINSTAEVRDDDTRTWPLTIGRPVDNTQVYVLDEYREPVGVGVVGEIYVGGHGVGAGYVGDPGATSAAFLRDPFVPGRNRRIYRTGDRGRWRADGRLEYWGRQDEQINLRGFRIEPGDVEARLLEIRGIHEAAVTIKQIDDQDRRLVAYVVPSGESPPSEAEVRAALRAELPSHMVPNHVVLLERLPRTRNDKLDRGALPLPVPTRDQPERWERAGEESSVAAVFADLLGCTGFGAEASFFELGGHSLLAARAVARLCEKFTVELSLADFIKMPTVRGVAEAVRAARGDAAQPLRGVAPPSVAPLAPAQRGIWFQQQLSPTSTEYLVQEAWELRGQLDVAALRQAVGALVRRHDALRTRFTVRNGVPQQSADAPGKQDPVVEVVGLELQNAIAQEQQSILDLETPERLKVLWIPETAEAGCLVVLTHHVTCDGLSLGILLRELGQVYESFSRGANPNLPAVIPYRVYAQWDEETRAGTRVAAQRAFWLENLPGMPTLELPTDFDRPNRRTGRGAAHTVCVGRRCARQIRKIAAAAGVPEYVVLLAGFISLLARAARTDHVVVGLPVSLRTRLELDNVVGAFVNTVPVHVRDVRGATRTELLLRVKEAVTAALAAADVPIDVVVQDLGRRPDPSRTPLYQATFAYDNSPSDLRLSGLRLSRYELPRTGAITDLTLRLRAREDGGLDATFEYAVDLFEGQRIASWAREFVRIVGADTTDAAGANDARGAAEQTERPQAATPMTASYEGAAQTSAGRPQAQGGGGRPKCSPNTLRRLETIWMEVLDRREISPDVDFFSLGGHSLLATKLVARIRSVFGVMVPLRDVFDGITLHQLAEMLEAGGLPDPPITCAPVAQPVRLSLGQERLWFLHQLAPDATEYQVAVAWRLRGKLSIRALATAVEHLSERHEVLRSRLIVIDGIPHASYDGEPAYLSGPETVEDDASEAQVLHGAVRAPIDLASAPPFRPVLLQRTSDEHVLVFLMHHMVVDGWSMRLIARDLGELYCAAVDGRAPRLPRPAICFADFAQWQRAQVQDNRLKGQAAYWREALADAPRLEFPADYERPRQRTGRGEHVDRQLDEAFARRVRETAEECAVTPFVVLLSVWLAFVARLAGQRDVVVGIPIAGREREETHEVVGFLANTIAVRADLAQATSVREWITQTRRSALAGIAHGDLPFDRVVAQVAPRRDLSRTPIYDAFFTLREDTPVPSLAGLAVSRVEVPWSGAQTDLSLLATLTDRGGAQLSLEYSSDLFSAKTVERWADRLSDFARALLRELDLPLVEVLSRAAEPPRHAKARRRRPRRHLGLDLLLRRRAAVSPGTSAVVSCGRRICDEDLQQASTRCALLLQASGVGPGDEITIAAAPTAGVTAAGVLGIMKAGGRVSLTADLDRPIRAREGGDTGGRLWNLQGTHVDGEWKVTEAYNGTTAARRPKLHACGSGDVGAPESAAGIVAYEGTGAELRRVELALDDLAPAVERVAGALSDGRQPVSYAWDGQMDELGKMYGLLACLRGGGTVHTAPYTTPAQVRELVEWLDADAITLVSTTSDALNEWLRAWEAGAPATPKYLLIGPDPVSDRELAPLARIAPGLKILNWYAPLGCVAAVALRVTKSRNGRQRTWRGQLLDDVNLVMRPEEPCVVTMGDTRQHGARDGAEQAENELHTYPWPERPGRECQDVGLLRDRTLQWLSRPETVCTVGGERMDVAAMERAVISRAGVEAVGAALVREDGTPKLFIGVEAQDDDGAKEERVRTWLQQVLPSAIDVVHVARIERLPRGPDGNLDRRELRAIAGSHIDRAGGGRPNMNIEQGVRDVWEHVLSKEVQPESDFFDCGGDSIAAARLAHQMSETLDTAVPVRLVFEHSDLRRYSTAVEGLVRKEGERPDVVVDLTALTRAAAIRLKHVATQKRDRKDPVLLTGATGFVGAFVLQTLRQRGHEVVCLVRSRPGCGRDRLREALRPYDLTAYAEEVTVAIGDITEPCLGLAADTYRDLQGDVGRVVHCAATVDHLAPFRRLEDANAGGIRAVLEFAAPAGIAVQHVSSTGVLDARGQVIGLSDIDQLANSGYSLSKWVAEEIVRRGREQGVAAGVVRLSRAGPDSRTGAWSTRDSIARFLIACVRLGLFPKTAHRVQLLPVDRMSAAMVHILEEEPGECQTIGPPRGTRLADIRTAVANAGWPLTEVSGRQWLALARRTFASDPLLGPALPLLDDYLGTHPARSAPPHSRELRGESASLCNAMAPAKTTEREIVETLSLAIRRFETLGLLGRSTKRTPRVGRGLPSKASK
jgi:amino acid adenylation domain-containing protein/thioester reductase-like protein